MWGGPTLQATGRTRLRVTHVAGHCVYSFENCEPLAPSAPRQRSRNPERFCSAPGRPAAAGSRNGYQPGGGWSGAGGSELTREGRLARSRGRAPSTPHARSGKARKLQAPDPRPRPSKEARLPRAADAADSLGLARLVRGAPWEQECQVWLWCFRPGDGGWRLASHGDSNCLEPQTQDHQEGNAKENKKPWREGAASGKKRINCPPLLKGVRNFAPEFPRRILTFLDVLPRTHFPCFGVLFVCFWFCFLCLGTARLHTPASRTRWRWKGKSAAGRRLG
ncbi:uncharacterized protein LOC118597758 [Onychomys torridus]|uniref:uncharacterized protein LOC118597758 n=1 Tax=Onychomys torridus TaxID=38674 RepID=UPI00167FA3DB|nr:uncharacterized protein LOC118597758 [Onychomys torridus]